MLWVLLWILSIFCSRRNLRNRRDTLPVPTGSVRFIDLIESQIVKKISTFRPLSFWVWPGKRLSVTLAITQVAPQGGEARAGLVEVDMSDGTVQCMTGSQGYGGGSGSGAEQHMQGVSGMSGMSTHVIILSFFKGCSACTGKSRDISSFLNKRRSARLCFEDVVSLVIAHGLLNAEARPTSLCVVLADLSEMTFREGQVVAW